MGFCRRCGEIVPVQATRCKCGGSAVAPAVPWNQSPQKDGGSPDRWAKTYVSTKTDKHSVSCAQGQPSCTPEKSEMDDQRSAGNHSPTRPPRVSIPQRDDKRIDPNHSPTRPPRRFPRPLSTVVPSSTLPDNRVSQHIASTTTQLTPTKKHTSSFDKSTISTPADVITSPDNATLAKAYGSILQRPDTLPIHTCAGCSSIFPPDATIYPDPQVHRGATPRFLCRSCFAVQGGSKGNCAECGREVLTVTKEGGFIESAGKFWHKRCFRCHGCHRHIGHAPMVDLFGNPSCSECFDTCLDRKGTPKKPLEAANNMGGMRGKSRESSPALEELSERLGIKRQTSPEVNRSPSRERSASPSPIRPFLTNRQDDSLRRRQVSPEVNRTISRETSIPPSPIRRFSSSHQDDSLRLRNSLGGSRSGTPPRQTKISGHSVTLSGPLRPRTSESVTPTLPTTPDLFSCSSSSDSLSSSAPSTPSNSPRQSLTPNSRDSITPKAKGVLNVVATGDAKCGRCFQSLFSISGEGEIVTVPADSPKGFPSSYHASCFRCFVCGDIFHGTDQGRATFLKDPRGVCHLECKMADEYINSTPPNSGPHVVNYPECITDQPLKTPPPLSRPFPRFGGSETCRGCRRPVSLMEYGVVPGPQNSRWHAVCLVCGGKGAKLPRPGCGKKLDSAAKTDRNGGVWCRECMLLLPVGTCSPQGSPTRGGLTPSYTGTGVERFPRPDAGRLFGQVTGNSFVRTTDTLTRQYTGGTDILPSGSVSPTRQMARSVSPTKGLIPVTRHPRPAGSWKHRSIDEGRGMFLVKQMTGNGQV